MRFTPLLWFVACIPPAEPSVWDQVQLHIELEQVDGGMLAHYRLDVPATAESVHFEYGDGTTHDDFDLPSRLWAHHGTYPSQAAVQFPADVFAEREVRVRAGVATHDSALFDIDALIERDTSPGTELHTVIFAWEQQVSTPGRWFDREIYAWAGRFDESGPVPMTDVSVSLPQERSNPEELNSNKFIFPDPLLLDVSTADGDWLYAETTDARLYGVPYWYEGDTWLNPGKLVPVPAVRETEDLNLEVGLRFDDATITRGQTLSLQAGTDSFGEMFLLFRQHDVTARVPVEGTMFEIPADTFDVFEDGPLEVHYVAQMRAADPSDPSVRLVNTRIFRAGMWLESP